MDKKELNDLLKRYLEGACTAAEKTLLEAWFLEYNEEPVVISPRKIRAIQKKVFNKLPGNEGGKFNNGYLLTAAAIALIMLSLIVNIVFNHKPSLRPDAAQEITPGGNRAMLTLVGGKKIDLALANTGLLATQPGSRIIKNADGAVVYQQENGGDRREPPGTNIITTPAGGSWVLQLPDGTRVWLNNASSLSYPNSFHNRRQRSVELEGEAYFEVTKDKGHPFIVKSGRQEVRVIGTHFNIRAFKDEPVINTTLLMGRVNVSVLDGHLMKHLLPGMQSVLSDQGMTVTRADTTQVMAWKKGFFRFNNTPIAQVMQELARWYDIEVHCSDAISVKKLNGRISRSKNLSQVLRALEATQVVRFKVEGRRLTVMK